MNAFADFAELFSDSKILVVDDVEDNRVVLQRQLERQRDHQQHCGSECVVGTSHRAGLRRELVTESFHLPRAEC